MSTGGASLKDAGSKQQVVIAGATAGLVSRFCIAPLDVIKIRLQLQVHSLSDPLSYKGISGPVYKGTFRTLKAILKEEGITGLWKGNIPAELLYVAFGAIEFATYRETTILLKKLNPRLPDAAESFIAGSFAGGVATSATYPLDLLRTRFAAQGRERVYSSIFASIREISRTEGLRGFYQGLGAGLIQIVPSMGVFFCAYESLRGPLAVLNLPFGSSDAATGVLASAIAKTCAFPLDLIRKRLQVQGPTRGRYVHRNIPVYRGVFKTLKSILQAEGVRGLYKGLTVSLMKAAPASAITMWTYERVLGALLNLER
ncbi:mitochondrial thiamine pyrophosphate transporter [Trichoglossum hirsutum]|uniref:Mitochondrial thiamine pyrophosphate carrier 1 n=1 Tax=Trichoglossum hirsutum TaxID=265104 RepID=A0A9P8RTL9_9PEZI|nr:mitochondrial thiamine pyrophosphate transporter [Trichoglossum hirsutum]